MLFADLYLDTIDFLKYLPKTDCAACGVKTCREFIEALRRGRKKPQDCPFMSPNLSYPLQVALDAEHILPKVPSLTVPQVGHVGLVDINNPTEDSPILVSGNNIHTQDVLTSILSTTRSPFFLVFTDTRGDTVDMAVIYQSLTAAQAQREILNSGIPDDFSHREVIIPGLAAAVGSELETSTGWDVIVGPICAGELPLFLADRWHPPDT